MGKMLLVSPSKEPSFLCSQIPLSVTTSAIADFKLPSDVNEPTGILGTGRVPVRAANRDKLFILSYKLMWCQMSPQNLLGSKQLHIVKGYHQQNANYTS